MWREYTIEHPAAQDFRTAYEKEKYPNKVPTFSFPYQQHLIFPKKEANKTDCGIIAKALLRARNLLNMINEEILADEYEIAENEVVNHFADSSTYADGSLDLDYKGVTVNPLVYNIEDTKINRYIL